jgi:hypothetical protein
MALKFVCSWYKTLDLDALATLRDGSKTLVDPVLQQKRQERAYTIAQYGPVDKFIMDPFPEADDEEEGETGDDEEEDGSEADGSKEDVDDEIEANKPPSKKLKLTKPASDDPASKANAPENSSTGIPEAGDLDAGAP